MALDRVGLDEERLELLQPCVLVGREHRVRRAALRQHFAALEDDVVFARVQRDAGVAERRAHRRVAREGVGFVVVVRVDRLRTEFAGEPYDLGPRRAVAHQQAPAEGAQLRVELAHAVVDELDAPVSARQRLEDGGVEHEHAPDLLGGPQCVVQRRVVVRAQIAPEPDQRLLQSPLHPGESASEAVPH